MEPEVLPPHRGAQLLWKCRRCAAVYQDGHHPNPVQANRELERACDVPDYQYTVHHCADYGRGIADLIGYRLEHV